MVESNACVVETTQSDVLSSIINFKKMGGQVKASELEEVVDLTYNNKSKKLIKREAVIFFNDVYNLMEDTDIKYSESLQYNALIRF